MMKSKFHRLIWPLALAGVLVFHNAVAAPKEGEVFGSWRIGCEGTGESRQCFASQSQYHAASNSRMLHVYVGFLGPNRGAMMVAMLPLGMDIQSGASLKINGGTPMQLRLQQCVVEGCQASVSLDDKGLEALTQAKSLSFTIRPFGANQALAVEVSLDGLGQAVTALK